MRKRHPNPPFFKGKVLTISLQILFAYYSSFIKRVMYLQRSIVTIYQEPMVFCWKWERAYCFDFYFVFFGYEERDLFIKDYLAQFCWYNTHIFWGGFEKKKKTSLFKSGNRRSSKLNCISQQGHVLLSTSVFSLCVRRCPLYSAELLKVHEYTSFDVDALHSSRI